MWQYIALIGSLLLTIPIAKKYKKKQKAIVILAFFLMWLVSGLRVDVGTDYHNYVQFFEYVKYGIDISWSNFEPGFIAIMKAIRIITDNNQVLFAVVSLITLFFAYRAYRVDSCDCIFSIFLYCTLYFYFNSFNAIRQYMAMSLIMVAMHDLIEKKYLKYAIKVICISLLFHTSGLVMLVLLFHDIGKKRIKSYYAWMLVLFFVVTCGGIFVSQLVNLFPQYEIYLGYISGGAKINLITGTLNLLLLIALNHQNKNGVPDSLEDDYSQKISIYTMSCIVALSFFSLSQYNTMFSRVGEYFFVYSTFSIPLCLKHIKVKPRGVVYLIVYLYAIVSCVYYLINNNSGVVPYRWIWQIG